MWPEPNSKYLPRDPKGKLLMVQDPLDGKGLVHLVLCTKGDEPKREYLFKFYPNRKRESRWPIADLDCSDKPAAPSGSRLPLRSAVRQLGRGYADPDHKKPDRHPNFGEGKTALYVQDTGRAVSREMDEREQCIARGQKQDYIDYMPVFIMQDGTAAGSKVLAKASSARPDVSGRSPRKNGLRPDNTLSRNAPGAIATG